MPKAKRALSKGGRPPLHGEEMGALITLRVPAELKAAALTRAHADSLELAVVIRQLLAAYLAGEIQISLVRRVSGSK